MEPLSDDQLNEALRQWQAPGAPVSLVLPRRRWWQWLFTGSIRVPVPVTAAAMAALLLLTLQALRKTAVPPPQPPAVNFRDFQPVKEIKPTIIRSARNETR
jgi:hypothetical protein